MREHHSPTREHHSHTRQHHSRTREHHSRTREHHSPTREHHSRTRKHHSPTREHHSPTREHHSRTREHRPRTAECHSVTLADVAASRSRADWTEHRELLTAVQSRCVCTDIGQYMQSRNVLCTDFILQRGILKCGK